MNTTANGSAGGEATGNPAPAGRLARFAAAWSRFWFTPGDPTVLALVRISCGLVTFYTFFVYSFDLQALLGPHAWLDLETRQAMCREGPNVSPDADWPGMARYLARPEVPGRLQNYWDEYAAKWKIAPPAPWPKDAAEAARFEEYHALWGVDPRLVVRLGHPVWSIWFHVTDPTAMALVQTVILIVSFLFVLGFCTRITSVLTWFAALCYMHRAPASVFGADTMMSILLLYLMIGPSGAALSVDRLLARWWARARPRVLARWHALWGRRPEGTASLAAPLATVPDRPTPSVSANLAIRLLQVHLCFIYTSAGMAKLIGPAWWNGTAVWMTIANYEYAPMQYGWYVGILRFVAAHRWLFELCMTGACLYTLFFEITYTFLVWRPATRWLVLSMAILFHGFIGMFVGLKTFSLMMLALNLSFVPPKRPTVSCGA